MVKKRKKNDLRRAVERPLALGAFSIGTNIAGQSLQPLLPAGTVNPLTQLGGSAAQFVGPIGTIGLAGVVLKQTKRLKPKRRRR